MASYVVIPKTLNISEIENKNFALSPSLFKRVEIENQNVKRISELLTQEPILGIKRSVQIHILILKQIISLLEQKLLHHIVSYRM